MKIKCIKLLNASGEEVESSHWLTLGKVYDVMTIGVNTQGVRSYRIVSYWLDGQWPSMGLHQSECFELVDTHIPDNWCIDVNSKGYIEIAPKKWLENDFFDKFYDHDPEVYQIFQDEYNIIVRS